MNFFDQNVYIPEQPTRVTKIRNGWIYMGIIEDIKNYLNQIFGTYADPNDEINNIVSALTTISDKLNNIQIQHDEREKKALAEIEIIRSKRDAEIKKLDEEHVALAAAKEKASRIAEKIVSLTS